MKREIEFHPAARAEAMAPFAANPQVFPRVDPESRRAVLNRFPYLVVFREHEFHIQIVAIAHGRRRPNYWKSRA